MSVIDDEMEEALLKDASVRGREIASRYVREKLQRLGGDVSDEAVKTLVDPLFNPDSTVEAEQDNEPAGEDDGIVFDETDLENILAEIRAVRPELTNNLADQLGESVAAAAEEVLKSIEKDWSEAAESERASSDGFKQRLEERWGAALDSLRLLIFTCNVFNHLYYDKTHEGGGTTSALSFVMTRLHARALQVAREVLVLLENGFADGALARWRTLQEITVVAINIADGGESLARKYLDHNAFETKRALEFEKNSNPAVASDPSFIAAEQAAAADMAAKVLQYGKAFESNVGWAIDHLRQRQVIKPNAGASFEDLERAAQLAHLRPYYKLASYNVHAGVRAILQRLATVDDPTQMTAGASNAGLEEPIQHTAINLVRVTSLLVTGHPRFTDLVNTNVAAILRDRAIDEAMAAAEKLRRDVRNSEPERQEN